MSKRLRIILEGVVQGVGYRPFVHRLATAYNLKGFCLNSTRGLIIEVEGNRNKLETFHRQFRNNHPPLAEIKRIKTEYLPIKGYLGFTIKESRSERRRSTLVSPDICICDDCLKELFDPSDRRYHYPFINCTNCGPRFSIVKDIPYDRCLTTMNVFRMCPTCQAEYEDITSRRYHAQPNSCPDCGPHLRLLDKYGRKVNCPQNKIIQHTVRYLLSGKIVLIKGIGGFHIACLASNTKAVMKIREYKRRPAKPFALMAKSVKDIRRFCYVSRLEERLLTSLQRPIVLVKKKKSQNNVICREIAPNNNYLGFILPYTPIHYLLLDDEQIPALVMTSANLGDEPIIADEVQALKELKGLSDYILSHNRDIYNRCDDSIASVFCSQTVILRRARGWTPLPVSVQPRIKKDILACGPELKNTFALGHHRYVYISQHLGDLKTAQTLQVYKESISRFKKLFRVRPQLIASDMHPDYLSTRYAKSLKNKKIIEVQHHQAHIAACLAEHRLRQNIIGIALDGTGYGSDGRIWGGEFFIVLKDGKEFHRLGHLKYTPLPGGDAASHQPWRMALSYLYSVFGDEIYHLDLDFIRRLGYAKIRTIVSMIKSEINSPLSSSCGRLFEAIGGLLGICQEQTYEAQAAIELEMIASPRQKGYYRYGFEEVQPGLSHKIFVSKHMPGRTEPGRESLETEFIIDPVPIFVDIISEMNKGKSIPTIAGKFHNTVVQFCLEGCQYIRKKTRISSVALSGGVFQNRLFTEKLVCCLEKHGFEVYMPRQVPPNDGCISLGQLTIGARQCV